MAAARPRVLMTTPFTHQNGHFATFPGDVACDVAASGCEVKLVHSRPFAAELEGFGYPLQRTGHRGDMRTQGKYIEDWLRVLRRHGRGRGEPAEAPGGR